MALDGKEEKLELNQKGLEDEDLKTLLQINFSKLREMDISGNKIKDISCFKEMNMLNLEHLKMDDNQISNLNVFEEIKAPKLKILELQKNKFKSFAPLLNSELPSLQLLRIEGNDLDKSLKEFNQLLKKYTKQLIYQPYTFEDFNKKYECQIDKHSKIIKLTDCKFGNEILKDLYLLSSNYEETTELDLSNCNIDDISILSKIKFLNLKALDLSLNKIKSIEPLTKMRLNNLAFLYLQSNNISDFTPLTSLNAKNLKQVNISDNNIIEGSAELKKIKEDLTKKKIQLTGY